MKLDLSDLPIAPQQYRMAGIVLLGLGSIILILSIVFAFGAETRHTADKNHVQVASNDCVQRISALGLKPTPNGNQIQIAEPNMSQAVTLLAQSSQAVSLCPDWTLNQYCLGMGCKPAGLTMTLQYNDK